MYKRILIGTDGSELAERAIDHGLNLAKSVKSAVTIVHVTEPWPALAMAAEMEDGDYGAVETYEKAAAESAARILERSRAKAASLGVDCETLHVSDRKPAEGILEAAKKESCDLIVMASHGRRGLQRMLIGSQTAEVVSSSSYPVLVLR